MSGNAGGNAIEVADRLWRGEVSTEGHHPLAHAGSLTEVADGVAFIPSFANVSAFKTDDGFVLMDTGSAVVAATIHQELRGWSPTRLDTAIYSHGHIDHVFGVGPFEEEAQQQGWAPPRVVAHEALPPRFDRYIMTAGYNGVINQRQFSMPNLRWPTEYRYPDETYEDALDLDIGGRRFELHHAKGETDDATWAWIPDQRILCTGDLFIWASPNAGNPQKVQRYPLEWAQALRQMLALDAEWLLPGHGFIVQGADRIRQALTDTAELLEQLVDDTLALMNQGARLDEILHAVKPRPDLIDKPYLRPVYDEPEFVVRNIWRLYGGWYDGNPATLKPAPDAALARELAGLAGGATALADRAGALAESDDDVSLRLAGHLAELAALAAPDDAGVHRVRAAVFGKRAEVERSTMSKGVFRWAASESKGKSES